MKVMTMMVVMMMMMIVMMMTMIMMMMTCNDVRYDDGDDYQYCQYSTAHQLYCSEPFRKSCSVLIPTVVQWVIYITNITIIISIIISIIIISIIIIPSSPSSPSSSDHHHQITIIITNTINHHHHQITIIRSSSSSLSSSGCTYHVDHAHIVAPPRSIGLRGARLG